ncbi:MAG: ribonuclease HII [Candidatus Dormibacteria bacterium]
MSPAPPDLPDVWRYERMARSLGFSRVAGIDEAGRGPLAGPVVAASVVLPPRFRCRGLRDSKLMTEKDRERAFRAVMRSAVAVGVGIAEVGEIDRINIHRAGIQSMVRSVGALPEPADYLLVDGFRVPLDLPQAPIIKGDRLSLSVMAAAVVAKVTRDHLMEELDRAYPGYGFASHKGYSTPEHQRALTRLGPCPEHRRSFRRVGQALMPEFDFASPAGDVPQHLG